ncbi:MAG: T9SS type A sorting domain-containing protein [Bacteroidetes bacterium]|nr:T9SS type A sorting domain-containing protein [Bacteroidota bacterium]
MMKSLQLLAAFICLSFLSLQSFSQIIVPDGDFGFDGVIKLEDPPFDSFFPDAFHENDLGEIFISGRYATLSYGPALVKLNGQGQWISDFAQTGIFINQNPNPFFNLQTSWIHSDEADNPVLVCNARNSLIDIGKAITLDSEGNETAELYNTFTSLPGSVGSAITRIKRNYYNTGFVVGGKLQTSGALEDVSSFVQKIDFNGIVDEDFGENGKLLIGADGYFELLTDLTLQDEQIVVVTTRITDSTYNTNYPRIHRFYPDGTTDMSFGIDGISSLEGNAIYAKMEPEDILATDIGNIFVSLRVQEHNNDIWYGALLKLKENGKIDLTFGENGLLVFPDGIYSKYSGICEAENLLILGGNTSLPGGNYQSVFIQVINQNGNPSPNFGTNGIEYPALINSEIVELKDVARGINDQIYLIGLFFGDGLTYHTLVARYLITGLASASDTFEEKGGIEVSPNPASQEIKIRFTGSVNIEDLVLYEQTGKKIQQFDIPAFNRFGQTEFSLELPNKLPHGIYLLHIRTTDQSYVEKLIIAHPSN